jgi:c-di-AMP phosphodiesterase-like protein
MNVSNYINPILLLILAFLPNYTGNLLGCKLTKLISESSTFLKFIYLIVLVFSSFIIFDKENTHPVKSLVQSIVVVFIFNMFNRQKYITLVIALIFLISMVFIHKLKTHYESKVESRIVEITIKIEKVVTLCLVGTLCIGFILYFIEKKNEYKSKFDTVTFLLGNEKCKSLHK